MTATERDLVRNRADRRCEYCHLPDFAVGPSDFHVEHIIAKQHGGSDDSQNLAWACMFCNLQKDPNLASFDPDTGNLTSLFHPRREKSDEHFRLSGQMLEGRTAVGRTTAWLLQMNSDLMKALRMALMEEGRW